MTPDEASTTDWSLIFSGVGALAGVFGVVIGLISLWSLWARAEDKLEERIRDDEDRAELRRELSRYAQGGMNWRNRLVRLNTFLDGPMFQGPWWGGAAFVRCYQIAIIYPALLVLAAWAVADVTDFGGAPIGFSETDGWWNRAWRAGVVLLASAVVYCLFYFDWDHPPHWLLRLLKVIGAFGRPDRWLAKSSAGALASKMVIAILAFALAVDSIGTVALVLVLPIVLAGFLAGPVAAAFAVSFSLTMTIASSVAIAVGLSDVSAAFLLFLFLLLPLSNAVLDWLSWGVTRSLLRRAAQSGGGFLGWIVLIGELILDLLAAALFLTGLAILLPMVFELWNRIGIAAHIDWVQMANDAYSAPFGAGLLVAGMLLTTFLPTLIHLTYGLYGAVYAVGGDVLGLQRDLSPGRLVPGKVHRLARRIMYLRLSWVPSTMLALITMALLMAPFYFWLDGFALHLREAADWGVDWIWGGAITPPSA